MKEAIVKSDDINKALISGWIHNLHKTSLLYICGLSEELNRELWNLRSLQKRNQDPKRIEAIETQIKDLCSTCLHSRMGMENPRSLASFNYMTAVETSAV